MLKKSILMSLLLCVSLNAKDIYLNGTIIKNGDSYFKNISLEEISNQIWLKVNFKDIMFNKYNNLDKALKDMISFEEYQENEIQKIKKDYILLNSTGLNKKEYVKLYLDVLNLDLESLIKIKNSLDKPFEYNNMIEFINKKSNNYEEINNYKNNLESIREMIVNYKFYNYAGKINVNKKINIILNDLDNERKDFVFDLIRDIKPNIDEIENLELIISYYDIFINHNKVLPELYTKDPLIKMIIKLNSETLTINEYKKLKKQILLLNYKKYLIYSDYIDDLFKKIEKNDIIE